MRGVVLTGAGQRAFCAGVDLDEARRQEPATIEAWFGAICGVYRAILDTRKPVVAAINGVAAGAGFQMALACDMRLAAPNARLGQPEIAAGIPSIMGAHWMSLHLPWSVNQDLSFTGRLIDAEEAAALHLLRIVPADALADEAAALAAPGRRSHGRAQKRASASWRSAASTKPSAPPCSASRKLLRAASRRPSCRPFSPAAPRADGAGSASACLVQRAV